MKKVIRAMTLAALMLIAAPAYSMQAIQIFECSFDSEGTTAAVVDAVLDYPDLTLKFSMVEPKTALFGMTMRRWSKVSSRALKSAISSTTPVSPPTRTVSPTLKGGRSRRSVSFSMKSSVRIGSSSLVVTRWSRESWSGP